jgi:hypothetical protein
MSHVKFAISLARNPALIDSRTMTRSPELISGCGGVGEEGFDLAIS